MKPRVKAGFIGFTTDKSKRTGMPHRANLIINETGHLAHTSRIVAIRPQENEIETLNTIYEITEEE